MSRIKAMGMALVLAASAAVGLQARTAEATDCNGCWSAGSGSTCYAVGSTRCMGGGSGCIGKPPGPPGCGGTGMGYLFECTPDDWRYTGYRC